MVDAARDDGGLVPLGVDGVDDKVNRLVRDVVAAITIKILEPEDGFDVLFGDEVPDDRDVAERVDVPDARRHGIRLGRAHRRVRREHLPVDVGDADDVEVDEGEGADAAPGQRLRGPRAHAAHPEDRDVRGGELFEAPVAVEATRALEPELRGRLVARAERAGRVVVGGGWGRRGRRRANGSTGDDGTTRAPSPVGGSEEPRASPRGCAHRRGHELRESRRVSLWMSTRSPVTSF